MLRISKHVIVLFSVIFAVLLFSCDESDNPVSPSPELDLSNGWELVSASRWWDRPYDLVQTANGDVFICGSKSVVRYSDERWYTVANLPDGKGKLWACENDGLIILRDHELMRYVDGGIDTVMTQTDGEFSDIWGSSEDNIFVTGWQMGTDSTEAFVVHYDGDSWTKTIIDDVRAFRDVWVSPDGIPFLLSQNEVWTFGESGWFVFAETPSVNAAGLTGTTGSNLYVWTSDDWCCFNDTCWRYNAGGWFVEDLGCVSEIGISEVKSPNSSFIVALGFCGNIAISDGQTWTDIPIPMEYCDVPSLAGCWGSNANDIWVVSRFGEMFHFDGSEWLRVTEPIVTSEELVDVCVIDDNTVFIGSRGQVVFEKTASGWNRHFVGWHFDFVNTDIKAVWGTDNSNVYAIMADIGIFKYDGSTWDLVRGYSGERFFDIWGASADDIYAVGSLSYYGEVQPLVVHWDGRSWSRIETALSSMPISVCGLSSHDVYIFHENAYQHFDGLRWTAYECDFSATSVAASANCLWTVTGTAAYRYASGYWTEEFAVDDYDYMLFGAITTGIWACADGIAYSVGSGPTVARRSIWGVWSEVPGLDLNPLNAIDGSSPNNIWAVGKYGTIWHKGR